jgi:hypothetical protein
LDRFGLNLLDQIAPEGTCSCANEWLLLILCDAISVDQFLLDGVDSRQHTSHWGNHHYKKKYALEQKIHQSQ